MPSACKVGRLVASTRVWKAYAGTKVPSSFVRVDCLFGGHPTVQPSAPAKFDFWYLVKSEV